MLQEDGGYSGDTEVFVAFGFDLKPSLSSGAIVANRTSTHFVTVISYSLVCGVRRLIPRSTVPSMVVPTMVKLRVIHSR